MTDQPSVDIQRLTRERMHAYIKEICAIEIDAVESSAGTYRDPWGRDEFTADLPGKWLYSRIMMENGVPAGFLVMSDKNSPGGLHYLHAHRAAVVKGVRRPNLLLDAYQDVFREGKSNGLRWFVTKQQSYHPAMLLWYVRVLGCTILKERKRIEDFAGPLPGSVRIEGDGLVVRGSSASRDGQYFIAREI